MNDDYFDALKRYAIFEGRATRREFGLFHLGWIIATITAGLLDNLIDKRAEVLVGIVTVLHITPWVSVNVRRLHDLNFNGYWMWVWIVSIPIFVFTKTSLSNLAGWPELLIFRMDPLVVGAVSAIFFGYFYFVFFRKGTEGGNKFGLDRLQNSALQPATSANSQATRCSQLAKAVQTPSSNFQSPAPKTNHLALSQASLDQIARLEDMKERGILKESEFYILKERALKEDEAAKLAENRMLTLQEAWELSKK